MPRVEPATKGMLATAQLLRLRELVRDELCAAVAHDAPRPVLQRFVHTLEVVDRRIERRAALETARPSVEQRARIAATRDARTRN